MIPETLWRLLRRQEQQRVCRDADPPPDHDVLLQFTVPSEPGNERAVAERVAAGAAPLRLTTPQLERLKTAVAEATMNAIEHGNASDPRVSVSICLAANEQRVLVRITTADQVPRRIRQRPQTLTPSWQAGRPQGGGGCS